MFTKRPHNRDVADGASVCRGQSGSVGLILLTIVALTLTVTLATFSLGIAPSEDDEVIVASVDITATATADTVTVTHEGGDSFSTEALSVELNGGQQSVGLDAFSTRSGSPEEFRAGEQREYDLHPTRDRVTVAVVHDPTGTVLAQERFTP